MYKYIVYLFVFTFSLSASAARQHINTADGYRVLVQKSNNNFIELYASSNSVNARLNTLSSGVVYITNLNIIVGSGLAVSNNKIILKVSDITNSVISGFATTNYVTNALAGYLPLAGGTMSGGIDMAGFSLSGLDQLVSDGGQRTIEFNTGVFLGSWDFDQQPTIPGYLPLSGGTMSGGIDMSAGVISGVFKIEGTSIANIDFDAEEFEGPWVFDTQPTIPGYQTITGAVATYLPLSGGVISGPINMSDFAITQVGFLDWYGQKSVSLEEGIFYGPWEFLEQPIIPNYQTINGTFNAANLTNLSAIAGSGLGVTSNRLVVTGGSMTNYLPLAGGVMTGNIDMNERNITRIDNLTGFGSTIDFNTETTDLEFNKGIRFLAGNNRTVEILPSSSGANLTVAAGDRSNSGGTGGALILEAGKFTGTPGTGNSGSIILDAIAVKSPSFQDLVLEGGLRSGGLSSNLVLRGGAAASGGTEGRVVVESQMTTENIDVRGYSISNAQYFGDAANLTNFPGFVATTNFVTNALAGYLPLSGGAITGTVTMTGNTRNLFITNNFSDGKAINVRMGGTAGYEALGVNDVGTVGGTYLRLDRNGTNEYLFDNISANFGGNIITNAIYYGNAVGLTNITHTNFAPSLTVTQKFLDANSVIRTNIFINGILVSGYTE